MQLSRSAVMALREEGPSLSLEVMRTGVVPPTRSLEAAYSDHGSTHHHHHHQHTAQSTTTSPNLLEDTEELISLMRRDLEWMVSETRAALEANHNTRTAIDRRNDALREQLLHEVGQQQQHHPTRIHHGIKRVVSSHSTATSDPHTTTNNTARQASPSLPPSYEAVVQADGEEGGSGNLPQSLSAATAAHYHQPSPATNHSSRRYVVGVGQLESPPRPSNRDGLPYEHPHHYNPPAGGGDATIRHKPPAPPTTRPSPLSMYFEEEVNEPQPKHAGSTKKMFQMEFSPPSRAPPPTNNNKGSKHVSNQPHNVGGQRTGSGGGVARRPVLTSELQGLRRDYESYAGTRAVSTSSRRGSSERPPPPPTHQPKRAPTPVVVVGTVPPQSTYRADAAFERPSTSSIAQLRAQQPEVAAPNRRVQQHQEPVPVERISLAPRRVDGAHQPISPQPTTDNSRTPSAPHVVDLSPQLSPPRGGGVGGIVGEAENDPEQYSGPVRNNRIHNPPVPARTFTVDSGPSQRGAVRSPERLIYAPPVTQSMMRDAAEQQPLHSTSDNRSRPLHTGGVSRHESGGGSAGINRNNKPSPQHQEQHPTGGITATKAISLGGHHNTSTSRESSVLSPRQPSREWLEKAALEQKELARTFDAVYESGPPRLSTTEQWVDTHIQFETACGLQRQGNTTPTTRHLNTSTSSRMTANIRSPRPSSHISHRAGPTGADNGAVCVENGPSSAVASLRQQHQLEGSTVPVKAPTNISAAASVPSTISSYNKVGGGGSTSSTVRRMMSPLKQ